MNWYYLESGIQRGPITEAEFPALFQIGVLGPATYLWCEGMTDWKTYGELLGAPVPSGPVASTAPARSSPPALSVRKTEAAPVADRMTDCSQCGATVPSSQIMRIGTSALCPKCQGAYRRQAQTAFGNDVSVVYAKPLVRLVAAILDDLICFAGALVLVLGVTSLSRLFFSDKRLLENIGIGMLICMILWVLDYFVGRIARSGATPGMKLFKIKVVNASGGRVGLVRAFCRFVMIRLINTLTLGLAHLIVFFDKESRSLHDIICGTIVIKT